MGYILCVGDFPDISFTILNAMENLNRTTYVAEHYLYNGLRNRNMSFFFLNSQQLLFNLFCVCFREEDEDCALST